MSRHMLSTIYCSDTPLGLLLKSISKLFVYKGFDITASNHWEPRRTMKYLCFQPS